MNRKILLPMFVALSFISWSITPEAYRELCMRKDLSYQKQLICQKHKKRIQAKQRSVSYTAPEPVEKTVTKPAIQPKDKPLSFKQQRLARQAKPYIPGAYKKDATGDDK